MRVLEILDRERASERKDHRVPQNAENQQVPIRFTEFQHVAHYERLGRRGTPERLHALPINAVVDQRGNHARARNDRGNDQRRLPARRVGVREPRRRHVRAIRAATAERERETESQCQAPSGEIVDHGRHRRDVERLGSDAEQQPARGHLGEAATPRGQHGTQETDDCRGERHLPGTEAIDEKTADDEQHYVRKVVDGVEHADLRVREMALLLEQIRYRTDRVIDVVVADGSDGGHREDEPCRARRGAATVHPGDPHRLLWFFDCLGRTRTILTGVRAADK